MADFVFLTYRFAVKDRHAARLRRMSRDVNQVWNWCGGAQEHARRVNGRWPNLVSLGKGLSGLREHIALKSDIFQAVAVHWLESRDRHKRRPKWRVSFGGRRSLGWVPFQAASRNIRVTRAGIRFDKRIFRIWQHREIPDDIRSGSFNEDADGRWYLNLVCRVAADRACGVGEVGIDLGLKDFAALSDGSKIANPRHVRKAASALAKAQRAGRKRLARRIHRKVAAQRRHFLHTESTRIARTYQFVAVGDVNSAGLARTRMAKSVLDAGWSSFRQMLSYKLAMTPGSRYVEADERYSTRTCSCCGSRAGAPRGVEGLGVRSWECEDCGTLHDRDTNAALNILASGRNIALHETGSRLH
ncbi:RNA-guided endonuclease InsQ/TnpB family protein [Methylobacterium sp. NPDC080182]|uniref:RNA-guided endonuclease InsQ/TnpB family protein n=1 Tax=Methylobacterium sp. NPDC080182 TaxID=3390590 RepID=UPI003D02DCAC